MFGEFARPEPEPTIAVKTLHAKIGVLTLENDFLSGALPTAKLSVSRQATALGISRGSIYYQHRPVSDAELN